MSFVATGEYLQETRGENVAGSHDGSHDGNLQSLAHRIEERDYVGCNYGRLRGLWGNDHIVLSIKFICCCKFVISKSNFILFDSKLFNTSTSLFLFVICCLTIRGTPSAMTFIRFICFLSIFVLLFGKNSIPCSAILFNTRASYALGFNLVLCSLSTPFTPRSIRTTFGLLRQYVNSTGMLLNVTPFCGRGLDGRGLDGRGLDGRFDSIIYLRKHFKFHRPDVIIRNAICMTCGRQFRGETGFATKLLTLHMKKEHNNSICVPSCVDRITTWNGQKDQINQTARVTEIQKEILNENELTERLFKK